MKKRRELDALVSKPSRPKTKNGNHELLRNDSYSSEGEEFVLPEKDATPTKRPKPNFCFMCLTIFSTIMLLSSFGIMASLFWMFVQLKTEVQELKIDITKVESSTSQKIKDFIVKEIQTNLLLKNMEIKNKEMSSAAKDILSLQDQMAALHNLTSSLSPSYFSVVDEIKGLSKTLADDGSFLKTLKEEVSELKNYKMENKESWNKLHDEVRHFKAELEKLENSTEVTNARVLHLEEKVANTTQLFGLKFNESRSVMENFNTSLSLLLSQVSSLQTKLSQVDKNKSQPPDEASDTKPSTTTTTATTTTKGQEMAPRSEMVSTSIPQSSTTHSTLHAA